MRLIDADALQEKFEEVKQKVESLPEIAQIIGVQSIIDNQPTAYDADKVVEQLEGLRQNEIKLLCEHESDTKDAKAMRGHNVLQDAIKMVKSGGIE